MSDFFDDPAAWRDAMLPPLTFEQALKAARKAKARRFVWRGASFDLAETDHPSAPEATDAATANPWDKLYAAQ
jgi:hypothetical protein